MPFPFETETKRYVNANPPKTVAAKYDETDSIMLLSTKPRYETKLARTWRTTTKLKRLTLDSMVLIIAK